MSDLVVTNGTDPTGRPIGSLAISGGRFVSVAAPDAVVLDADGSVVAPGFVDVQINGGYGADFTVDPSTMWDVAARLPRHGVTAFLPTIISSTADTVRRAREAFLAGPPAGWRGSTPLGIHVEGPMIAPARRGAHPLERLLEPYPRLIERWGGVEGIRMVTMAAELTGAIEMIGALVRAGVVVSLGHSDCTLEEALRAIDAGASAGTHLFNAMSGLDHRSPGLAAALLGDERVVAGMIVDGVHVHAAMVELAARALGPERLVLVTDAIAAMGAGDGVYQLGDVQVRVEGGRVVSGEDTLAGSVLTMDAAVRNLMDQASWSLEAALRTATATPSDLVVELERGRLGLGARGDLVVLTEGGDVLVTVVAGEILEDAR